MQRPRTASTDADGWAVSPVIGVVLLVAVVLLALVFGGIVLGFGDALESPAPQASFSVAYHADGAGNDGDGAYHNVTHEAGDICDGSRVFVVDDAGNAAAWHEVWIGGHVVEAGEYAHIDGVGSDSALERVCGVGQTYRVVFRTGGGTDAVLEEFTVPTEPTAGTC